MAEIRTETISNSYAFTRCGRDYRGASGTTYSAAAGNKTLGFNYSFSSSLGIQDYYSYCDVASYLPDDLKADNTVVTSLAVTIYGYKHGDSTMNPSVNFCAAGAALSGTNEQKFNICSDALTFSSQNVVSSSSETAIAQVSDLRLTETNKENILRYGIVARVPRGSTEGSAWVVITKIVLDLEFYTTDSPPDVNITQPDDRTMILDIAVTDGADVAWEFYHPAGSVQSGYQLVYKYVPITNEPLRSMTEIFSGTAVSHHITSEQLPPMRSASGNGGYFDSVVFWVKAYIKNNSISSPVSDDGGKYSWRLLQMYFPKPYNLSPKDQTIILGDEDTVLSWKIKCSNESSGTEIEFTNYPTEYDIEYSSNAGETWNVLASKAKIQNDNGVLKYTVPANTFPPGIVSWRVRAYAGGKTIEMYESATVTVRVQASTSSVTCDGKPRPTISWSSSAQIAYQVRFSDYDSGTIYGSATSHTIPYYYADGTYPVQVRTQASDGTWSDWTELEYVTIKNTAPAGALTISAVRTRHTAVISWESTAAFDTYILYRNGIPVYIGNALTYTDVAAYGSCDYYVRGISGVNYLQSDTVTIDAIPAVDCMYDTHTAQWIPLKYSLQPRVRNYSDTANVVYKSYAGRSYPVAYVDGTKERQANLSYAFKTREEAERLKSSLGHLVIYKDTAGGRIIGILGAISWSVTKRFAANLTIVQVDFKEDVRYET